jgi:hypothetical protein
VAFFKVVHQFTEADEGFTEVWYREASDLTAAATFSPTLIWNGILFRNALVAWRKIRVSDTLNNRSSVLIKINQSAPFSNSSPSVNNTSLTYSINSPAVGATRQVWLRGLDQNAFGRAPTSGADRPDPGTLNQIFNYLLQLQSAGYRVRSLKKITESGMSFRTITGIQNTVSSGFITLVYTGDPVAVGDSIIISQMNIKDWPGLKGTFQVQPGSTPGLATVKYNYHFAGPWSIRQGRFRPAAYNYGAFNLTLSSWNKLASRDTGGNPIHGRGRRSSVRIRSA